MSAITPEIWSDLQHTSEHAHNLERKYIWWMTLYGFRQSRIIQCTLINKSRSFTSKSTTCNITRIKQTFTQGLTYRRGSHLQRTCWRGPLEWYQPQSPCGSQSLRHVSDLGCLAPLLPSGHIAVFCLGCSALHMHYQSLKENMVGESIRGKFRTQIYGF